MSASSPQPKRQETPKAAAAPSLNVPRKTRAAVLVADDRLSDNEIAAELNINRRTLTRWRDDEEFMKMVDQHVQSLNAEVLRYSIAKRRDRISTLNELHEDLLYIKRTRGKRIAEELAEGDSAVNATRRIFGDVTPEEATSGLLVREETMSASGQKVVNYRLDNALIKAIGDLEKQASQDLGQWTEQSAMDVNGGFRLEIVGMSSEDLP